MKIISFLGIKGGIGKSSLAKNFVEKLRRQLAESGSDKKILVLDLDHQCNLTQSYGYYEHENTIVNIFLKKDAVAIHNVNERVDLIAGAMDLDVVEGELETKIYKDMLLYMWLDKNYEAINGDQYEYVVIDCRPDFSIATRNAINISNMLVSPIIPSNYSLTARANLESRLQLYRDENIDYKTGESNVDAELYYVGNMIKHNTKSSKELVQSFEGDDRVLGVVPYREIFNRSTFEVDENGLRPSVYELLDADKDLKSNHASFLKNLDEVFDSIISVLSQYE